ncbi:MAG: hypothetical protein NVS1B14_05510 [Vulcanimicrobiaceae bacterium]
MSKILISYRRSDAAAIVRAVYDRLAAHFGPDALFLDVDDIPYAVDFREHVAATLRTTDVVLAVIGPRWLGVTESGLRLHQESDPVRVELESTLSMRVKLLPVLIDGTPMPDPKELPPSLEPLAYLNAVAVSSGIDFDQHVNRLIAAIETLLGPKAPLVPRSQTPAYTNLRSSSPYVIALALGLPFVAAALGFAPPWPRGMHIVTSAGEAALMVALVNTLRFANRGLLRRLATAASTVLAVSCLAYVTAGATFTYVTPRTGEHWVKGYVCTPEAAALYKSKCPFLGKDELQGAEYEAERLWTLPSITVVKVAMIALWLAAFVSVAALAASSIVGARPAGRFP